MASGNLLAFDDHDGNDADEAGGGAVKIWFALAFVFEFVFVFVFVFVFLWCSQNMVGLGTTHALPPAGVGQTVANVVPQKISEELN